MKARFILSFFLLLSCIAARAAEPPLYLGALEDVPAHKAGKGYDQAVRVLFRKSGREWLPFPSDCADSACLSDLPGHYPKTVNWNVGFSGRRIGHVSSIAPEEYHWYDEAGLEEQGPEEATPVVGKRTKEFAGWRDIAVYRPLVAVSAPNLKDPDHWRRAKPHAELLARLRLTFRSRFPTISNCNGPRDENPSPWAYADSNIKLMRFYASSRGWSVAEIALQEYRCDGPPDDAFIDQWFAVSPKGDVTYLDGGLHLVDAGDYDRDGKSELLFAIARYDEGGYTLYYDDFARRATFTFHYH